MACNNSERKISNKIMNELNSICFKSPRGKHKWKKIGLRPALTMICKYCNKTVNTG